MVAETSQRCRIPTKCRPRMAEARHRDYSAPGGRVRGISSGAIIGAIIAATALLGLVLAALVVARRSPPREARDDRLVQAVDEMRTRMDDLGRDLSDALDRAERESRRNRFLSDLGSSVEFEELLDRVLDAALEVPGFDAAMVALDDGGGASTMATRGMTPEEAAHPPSSGAGGVLPAGPITVNYRYGAADAADTHLIRGGLFLPLVGRDGSALGSLALFWRSPGYEPAPERVAAIQQIAETCIPAIENARRYREARQLAETDALTGLLQPAVLPRDASARGAASAALRPPPGAPDPRPRRLQGGQRPDRAPGGRRGARADRGAAAQRDPLGRHRLPGRR